MQSGNKRYGALLILLGIGLSACRPEVPDIASYTIGFSQCTTFDNWRKAMQEEMYRELSFHDDLTLIVKDAGGDNDKQIEQIREFIDQKVDLLIVSPNEAAPITPIVDEAFQRGIPVILIDRKTNSSFYTAFIGADNYKIGQFAARYAMGMLKKGSKIIEVKGLKGSTAFIDRHNGFASIIKGFPEFSVAEVEGDWGDRKDAEEAFSELLENGEKYDLIYAHNDIMGFAAYNVLQKKQYPYKPKIIGVDGLAGPNGGIQYVADDILYATILYPTGGDMAIQVAADILHQRPYSKENELTTTIIDSTNVRVMQMQTNKILGHQRDINRMVEKISQQRVVYKSQQYILYCLAILFVVSSVSFAYALRLLRERREINKRLNKRNEEVLKQKNEVLEMSEKANEAIQGRIKFFANISHEFRTPLTLILGQLEELQSPERSENPKKDLGLIKHNVLRLNRLVGQLMDVQKMENSGIKLQVGKYNLVSFLEEIIDAFKPLAKKGGYQFHAYYEHPEIWTWFDRNMLDKVFFNLLSNAFKFTSHGGKIRVSVELESHLNEVKVTIEDNGMGMSEDQIQHAFDRFYQGDESRVDGTGLGLSLSKELMELHHGQISVTSEKGSGTRFTVNLKLGESHLEALSSDGVQTVQKMSEDINYEYYSECEDTLPFTEQKNHTVLVIEDDHDLRTFFAAKLSKHFNVLHVENGSAGISLALEKIPDLILCDMKLPKVNGMEVLSKIKSDYRTAHISFIVMTSNDSLEEKVAAIRLGADDFFTKPFHLKLLIEKIKTLLANREKLKEHYVHELPTEVSSKGSSSHDKKFINDFVATVEANITDPTLDVGVLCEKLGISRIQLYRKVKSTLGYSVGDYITNVRLKKAKYLLGSTDQPVAEIGYSVGFSSPSYFSATFRGHFGVTPKEFQKANRPT